MTDSDEHFRLKPPTPSQLAVQTLPVIIAIFIILVLEFIIYPSQHQFDGQVLIPLKNLPAILLTLIIYQIYVTGKRIKKRSTFLLTINDEFLTLVENGKPSIRIACGTVDKIVKSYKGIIYITSSKNNSILVIPSGIEDEDQLLYRLKQLSTITDNSAPVTRNTQVIQVLIVTVVVLVFAILKRNLLNERTFITIISLIILISVMFLTKILGSNRNK